MIFIQTTDRLACMTDFVGYFWVSTDRQGRSGLVWKRSAMHPHRLIIGRTGSGKSRFAKQLCSRLRLARETVIAFNPTGEDGYSREDVFGHIAAEWESWDDKEFVKKLRGLVSKKDRVFVIIDEDHEFFHSSAVSESVDRDHREALWH